MLRPFRLNVLSLPQNAVKALSKVGVEDLADGGFCQTFIVGPISDYVFEARGVQGQQVWGASKMNRVKYSQWLPKSRSKNCFVLWLVVARS